MKRLMAVAAATILFVAPALAQPVGQGSDSTVKGTITAPGNSSGAPSAQTSAGQLSTTNVGPGGAISVPSTPPGAEQGGNGGTGTAAGPTR